MCCFLVQFSQKRILWKNKGKKKTQTLKFVFTGQTMVQIQECIFFFWLAQVLGELCHFNNYFVRIISWQSSKNPCCARSLTAPFPLSVLEICEVKQILPRPTNEDLDREITRVRNHILTLGVKMAHCPSWHQKNKLFWTYHTSSLKIVCSFGLVFL